MTLLGLPQRSRSALKGLCCLAKSNKLLRSHEVADCTGVSRAEMAKVLQLLAWGGFVTSRRGSLGGFRLAVPADRITTGEVLDFFLSKQQPEPDGDCPVMAALYASAARCQQEFARLTLADVAAGRFKRPSAHCARKVV